MPTEAEGFSDDGWALPGMPSGEVPALDDAGLDRLAGEIRRVLDDVLGPETGVRTPLLERVALLAARCKAAEARVAELLGVDALPGMPGAEL